MVQGTNYLRYTAILFLCFLSHIHAQDNFTMPECAPPGCPAKTRCTISQREKCSSRKCVLNILYARYECAEARCDDGVMNAWETAVDCGGDCKGCADNTPCFAGQDCRSGVCLFRNAYAVTVESGNLGGSCRPPTCFDLVSNGIEPDIDCGDTACCSSYKIKRECPFHCADGFKCNTVYDCKSERCFRNVRMNGDRFCAAPRVSDSRPEYSTRIQGGVIIYGPRKLTFDPLPVLRAVSFMLDIPTDTLVSDALSDVQLPREYGNSSYLKYRLANGWMPGYVPPPFRRRLESFMDDQNFTDMNLNNVSGNFSTELNTDEANLLYNLHEKELAMKLLANRRYQEPDFSSTGNNPHILTASSSMKRKIRKRGQEFEWREGPRGIRRIKGGIPTVYDDDAAATEYWDTPNHLQQSARRLRTASSASASSTVPLSSFDNHDYFTNEEEMEFELEIGLGEGRRDITETEFERDFRLKYGEQALKTYRNHLHSDIDNLSTGNIPGGLRALQFVNYPRYNLSTTDTVIGMNIRYMAYVAPYEAFLITSRMTTLLNITLLPGGWAAERALQTQLDWLAQDRDYCLQFAANFTLQQFNTTGVDCSMYVKETNGTDTNTTDSTNSSSTHSPTNGTDASSSPSRRLYGSFSSSSSPFIYRFDPLDTSYLSHPYIKQKLREHLMKDCYWYIADSSTNTHKLYCPDAEPISSSFYESVASPLPAGIGQGRHRRLNEVLSPRGLQPSTIEGILPNIPRIKFADMLIYYGLNYDMDRGIRFLTDATIDTNSDPPSSVFQPGSITVIEDPRGRPDKPLYMGVTFPIQPTAILVDRHGRMVTSFVREMKIVAALDENLFPNDPKNPLTLVGFKSSTVSPLTGYAHWDDLEITAVVQNIFLNFSAVYITPFNQRLVLTGTSRTFNVLEPPPKPIVIYVRIPLHPAIVAAIAIMGASMVAVTAYSWTTILKWLHTTKARAELAPKRKRRFHRDGKPQIDDGVAYVPNKDIDKDENYEESVASDEEEAVVTEEENHVAIEPPPPLYSDKNIPGIGPAFITAFGQLENQLGEVEDDDIEEISLPVTNETNGKEKLSSNRSAWTNKEDETTRKRKEREAVRNEVEQSVRRYYHTEEPELIAAQRAAAAAAIAAEENRNNLLAHRIVVSVMGHYLFTIDTGYVMTRILDLVAPKTRAERDADRRLAETSRRISILQDVRIANLAHMYGNQSHGQDSDAIDHSDQDSIDRISDISGENGTNPKVERTGSSSGTPLFHENSSTTPSHHPVTDDEEEYTGGSPSSSSFTSSTSRRTMQRFAWTQMQAPDTANDKPLVIKQLPQSDDIQEGDTEGSKTHEQTNMGSSYETVVPKEPVTISSSSFMRKFKPLTVKHIPADEEESALSSRTEQNNNNDNGSSANDTETPVVFSTSRYLKRGSISIGRIPETSITRNSPSEAPETDKKVTKNVNQSDTEYNNEVLPGTVIEQ